MEPRMQGTEWMMLRVLLLSWKKTWVRMSLLVLVVTPATAQTPPANWEIASTSNRDGFEYRVYVETKKTPGRPAFRIEANFDTSPSEAAATLMASMSEESSATSGERRRVLEQTPNGALVHTYVDLPLMFSDRELAVQIDHRADAATGIHRIMWTDANDVLPPPEGDVLRLETEGHWEFRPAPRGLTEATYYTQAEVGGSLPSAVGDRLMKGQAVAAVKRLHRLIAERKRIRVASPPPNLD